MSNIAKAESSNNIKNGTIVVTCGRTGFPASGNIVYDEYVLNTPTISDIEDKYNNRFYNGIWVNIVESGIV
jgi:hypothetical protein